MTDKLIAVCMIVKNEEDYLPRALADLEGFWDELIIVNTGSDDRTVAIAQEFGATVLHDEFAAPGDKGKARNLGIDAATAKWIVVLDADETIAQPAELRTHLAQSQAHAVHVHKINLEPTGGVSLIWTQRSIFRRGLYRYKYREHEMPFPIADDLNEETVDYKFVHQPPAERKTGKVQPMLDRLLLDVEENPNDPHPIYFLHRQYMHVGGYDAAIKWGRKYLQYAGSGDRCECYGWMARAHREKGEQHVALQYLHRALTDQPNRRIWWVSIAEIYMAHSQLNLAMA